MRTLYSLMVVLTAVLLLAGCGGGSKELSAVNTGEVPDWFVNVPQDPNYLFAVQTATSQDLQLAIDKAITGARAEIGRQVDTKIKALQKSFQEEVGMGEDAQLLSQFTSATKTVVSTSLSGSRVRQQKQVRDGNMWRSYVMVEYPIGAANQALVNQLKANQQMYTRFRASETFKELEEEADKYDQFKKEQGQL
ncbi:MAG TPA: hypothetical protein PKN04_07310 [bacterium]|nr:hypothetical protein [bacterium]HNT65565.1 hypothetical protein [bacterium]HOX87377.1 hypothetical protein [bacterium]HPG46838.1 hypothetical protein [bacterium]HPM99182.1 hypothetical protein [bacterium]